MTPRSLTALAALVALWPLTGCGGSGAPPGDAARPRAQAPSEGSGDDARDPPLLRGGERVVFIGDSLAVEAPPSYADLLPRALGRRAPAVEVVNLAEAGTTSADWQPGSARFERRLGPELRDADLVVVTVGGNDLQEALGGGDGVAAASAAGLKAADRVLATLERYGRRLDSIFAAIRGRAPGTRIAYVSYPDYSRATAWREATGSVGLIGLEVGLDRLVSEAAGADLVIDMGPATARAGVDSLLADSEHLGPAGHRLYARRLAAALTRRR